MAVSINKDLQKKCEDEPLCADVYKTDVDKQNTMSALSTALLSVGVAAAGTGVVLLIVSKKKKEQPSDDVSVIPTVGESMVGATVVGRF